MSALSKFVEDLWESIFTPGPTPSLLIATNVTFASLQVVLFALLLATYSIHFVILSCLSAGLWWAINWFARELQASHDQELKEKARAARKTAQMVQTSADSDTEVETFLTKTKTKSQHSSAPAASKEVEAQEPGYGEIKQRASVQSQGSKSSVSTEDEWDKVSEYETEKTK
ncbi:V-type ATPase assembly factor PKR1 [Cytospora mali]|uniref:V-type ATPase assembly factor PKR1 n=1 Tax=Cytospora mali TaxID=578113 RepID=A0A194V1U2_CYTMA|nr:V-type ATPase assembly factor PKR1 [Valsa mali var. pyri (nom. inval.)]